MKIKKTIRKEKCFLGKKQGIWEGPSLCIFEAASGLEGDINSLNKVVECTRRKRPSSYFGFLKEGAPRSWVDRCLGIAMDLALHTAYHFPSSRDSPTHDPPLIPQHTDTTF